MTGSKIASLLPLALLAGCAATEPYGSMSEAEILELMTIPEPCGVSASRGRDENGDFFILADGATVRPCELMDAMAIAETCRTEAGELTPHPDYPDDWQRDGWTAPDLEVSGAQCRNLNEEGSEISCDFTVSYDGSEMRLTDHPFRHVYFEMHDEVSHTYFAVWRTSQSCLAPHVGV